MNNNYNKAFTIVCVIAVMLTVPFLDSPISIAKVSRVKRWWRIPW